MSREFVLRGYLGEIKQSYDYILIDCMPSLGMADSLDYGLLSLRADRQPVAPIIVA